MSTRNLLIFGDPAYHRPLVAELFTGEQVAAGFEGWRGLTGSDLERLVELADYINTVVTAARTGGAGNG